MIRGLPGEVVLDEGDGMVVRCTIKVEWIRAVERTLIGAQIATLSAARWADVRRAVVHVLCLDDEP
jgi:mRNA-degrading endonuclease toxin of MazEF toxin-antitoxin module